MNFFGGGEQKPAGPDPLFAGEWTTGRCRFCLPFFTKSQLTIPLPLLIIAATTEMEMYTDLFNKLTAGCFQKCSSRKHKEQDLSLGEMSCADRCVSKYLEAQQKIGIVLQTANEQQGEW